MNAATKSEWDKIKVSLNATISFLLKNGLDKGVLSAVRLSRLPDAWREGKVREHDDGRWEYIKLQPPQLQKLLYIDPTPPARPICDRWPKRDVVQHWLQQSEQGISDGDETGGAWLRRPLWYYSPVSKDLRRARERVETQCREAMA